MYKTQILSGAAADMIAEAVGDRKAFFIVDSRVAELYPSLTAGRERFMVHASEEEKNIETVMRIVERMLECGFDRECVVVGIGGGITTDMAGFVAATYMRGAACCLVPTTLLAQTDAAIGGKNGVNVAHYKNIMGTIVQPESVILDTAFLATLDDRQFRSGLAEAVKATIIGDAGVFARIEGLSAENLRADAVATGLLMRAAFDVKMSIVGRDCRETGCRRLLNLGHTTAHALEHLTRERTHGEAVAYGIAVAARTAVALGDMPSSEAQRIERTLSAFGFSLALPEGIRRGDMLEAMRKDKKNNGGRMRFVLPLRVGECTVVEEPFEKLTVVIGGVL